MKFSKSLRKLLEKAGLRPYTLAQYADVDASYVARLKRGEKVNPSRDVVLKLGQALLDNCGDISLEDVDKLLKAAGHGPLRRNRISILPK